MRFVQVLRPLERRDNGRVVAFEMAMQAVIHPADSSRKRRSVSKTRQPYGHVSAPAQHRPQPEHDTWANSVALRPEILINQALFGALRPGSSRIPYAELRERRDERSVQSAEGPVQETHTDVGTPQELQQGNPLGPHWGRCPALTSGPEDCYSRVA